VNTLARAELEFAPDHAAIMRAVHRAVADLRRGAPVLITAGENGLVVLAAETADPPTLARVAALTLPPLALLLAPSRAAALTHRPAPIPAGQAAIAFRLPPAPAPWLAALSDPTVSGPLPGELEVLPEPGEGPEAAGAIALAKLARLLPALVASRPRLDGAEDPASYARRHDILRVDAHDVLSYPAAEAVTLTRVAEARVPLEHAEATRIIGFRPADGGTEHLAMVVGNALDPDVVPLIRLHSECFTGDLLGSLRCDCGPQLRGAIERMGEEGAGILLYLAQEGRGIGLINKLRAYTLQDQGSDTLDANTRLGYGADERNFLIAASMLDSLGVTRVRLLTNNPEKRAALEACGIEVVERVKHAFEPTQHNKGYLETKAERFGHLLF